MNQNWKNIHPEFSHLWGEYFQWQWKNCGFDYQQTNSWIKTDLRPWEYNIAWWLANIKKQDLYTLNRKEIELLKREYYSSEETIEWLKKGFTAEEIKQWIKKGLKPSEYNLANYLSINKYNLSEELRQKYYQAQNWLGFNYPLKKRSEVKELATVKLNLQGPLKLEGFTNLEGIYCTDNKLTSLEFCNCPKLKNVLCQQNQLTNLTLANCPNITKLVANKNQLTSLDFLQTISSEKLEMLNVSSNNISDSELTPFQNFINLRHLGLGNWYKEIIDQGVYNRFHGSLEPLANMNNLEELDLAGTDIDSGWEYLSESLQILYLFAKEMPESQVKLIAKKLRKYGEATKDRHEDDNFAPLLNKYKTNKQIQALEVEKEQFAEQQKEINYLELRVNELTNLIKNQKEKIISTFLQLLPEKELVQQLITAHLKFKKAKKQGNFSLKLKKECQRIENELEDKLGEEFVEKIQPLLDDCEELITWELELKSRLKNKSLLIEGHKHILSITDIQEEQIIVFEERNNQRQIQEFEALKQQNFLILQELKEIKTLNQSENLLDKLVSQLKSKTTLTSEELAIIAKIKELLQKKNNFLIARQETITELQQCCDQLEVALVKGKYAKNEERSKSFAIVGKATGTWTFNIIEATGEAANLTNAHFKRLFTIKKGKDFQLILQDELEIKELESTYQELIKLTNSPTEAIEPFNTEYKIYQVITNIWVDKSHLDTADMKTAIDYLQQNLNLLEKELKGQENLLKKNSNKLGLNTSASIAQEESELQSQISQLQSKLEDLKNTAKGKLKSRSLFDKDKITEEREQILQKFLTNSSVLTKEERELLEKKLTKELLTNLSQSNIQLTEKQKQYTELQNQTQAVVAQTSQWRF